MANYSNQIDDFKSVFDGGTRPNRFVIEGEIGSFGAVESRLVKAGSVPVQTVGILQIPYRGRIAKIPGDRVYAEWTFTMIDDATLGIRSSFEMWHEKFNQHEENIVSDQSMLSGTGSEFAMWTVQQLDMSGNTIPARKIELHNCWPVEIGAIDLSYDTADTLTEYNITLAYDYLKLV